MDGLKLRLKCDMNYLAPKSRLTGIGLVTLARKSLPMLPFRTVETTTIEKIKF